MYSSTAADTTAVQTILNSRSILHERLEWIPLVLISLSIKLIIHTYSSCTRVRFAYMFKNIDPRPRKTRHRWAAAPRMARLLRRVQHQGGLLTTPRVGSPFSGPRWAVRRRAGAPELKGGGRGLRTVRIDSIFIQFPSYKNSKY